MATQNKYTVNGLIDTSNNVLDNINILARSAGCFVTWDGQFGRWSIIINEPGSSVKSFNDSNILGNINVSGTGVADLYNSVQIEFPHKDLRDATDYIVLDIPTADRFNGELDNQLSINLQSINDPIQATIIASQELKQSRVDKIIQFRTDFSANGLQAGDIIDITASAYDYTNKLFRIVQIEEEDSDDGSIIYNITALEYDIDVYLTGDLIRNTRTVKNGIRAKITNDDMAVMDDIDIGSQIGRLLAANAALGVINSLFSVDPLTGAIINEGKFADPDIQRMFENFGKPDLTSTASGDYENQVCAGNSATVSFSLDCSDCLTKGTDYEYDYTISGVTSSDIGISLTGTLTVGSSGANLSIPTNASAAGKTITVEAGGSTSTIPVVNCSTDPLPGTPGSEGTPGDPNNPRCEYSSVPVVWCAEYHPDTGALIGISVKARASFAIPQNSESTVTLPLSCSVSGGSITIDSTIDVASSSNLGGIPINVITNFNSVSANGLITGTTTTVYGYM